MRLTPMVLQARNVISALVSTIPDAFSTMRTTSVTKPCRAGNARQSLLPYRKLSAAAEGKTRRTMTIPSSIRLIIVLHLLAIAAGELVPAAASPGGSGYFAALAGQPTVG